ncbi:carboxypeptidase Q [Rhipicephalus sanguineus]|uniref:carboxypeptidase Q n=1 Tax=Rhipicephalus sanguineus TaxID=34632 RepID=UPI001893F03D|nr:carboxypeptidase Q [Rhipicephalus sanguineus]
MACPSAVLQLLLLLAAGAAWAADDQQVYTCNATQLLSPELVAEIRSYAPVVQSIIDYVLRGPERNRTYEELAKFVDRFGARISGSRNLENAIDYMVELLGRQELDRVYTERVAVPHWVRGNESAWIVRPRMQKLNMLGLGGSVGTSPNGITAPILVVRSFEELQSNASKARGKVVVFDEEFVSYGRTVEYRENGAAAAERAGAVAALVRSVTPFSIGSPHTGWMNYERGEPRIPCASITVEDAQLLRRLQDRGIEVHVHLIMDAQNLPLTTSRNTIAELKGTTMPDEVVLVSGHLDSWDVGQGAMDDGGGAFISWRALALLRRLGLRPRRTLRALLWTGEEEGVWGGRAYYERHGGRPEARRLLNLVMESDLGTFRPLGLRLAATDPRARCMAAQVLRLFGSINATQLTLGPDGPDIQPWVDAGVPGASLDTANKEYFYFHHTDGDSMTVEDPTNLDLCTALWAASAFVFADLSERLPRP